MVRRPIRIRWVFTYIYMRLFQSVDRWPDDSWGNVFAEHRDNYEKHIKNSSHRSIVLSQQTGTKESKLRLTSLPLAIYKPSFR